MKGLSPEPEFTEGMESTFPRVSTASADVASTRKGRSAEMRSDSMSPQGLKHRLSMLEKVVHSHVREPFFPNQCSSSG
jgi:hypothetical protein